MSISCFSQDLTCSDLKNGTFIIPEESNNSFEQTIIRNKSSQVEIVEISDEITTSFATIEWINECIYRLKYDDSKMDLSRDMEFINDMGGILIEIIKIEENCFYYNSAIIFDGKEIQKAEGSFCKKI